MATCKGCGKTIRWGILPDGTKVPLDPRPPIYEVYAENIPNPGDIKIHRADQEVYFVSHFATCPKANEFSRSKKKSDG